ncbi:cation:proton antiporter [Nocardioides massiliensis]|uniref:Multicomponent Na+:H+ antiporter subunit G n=1 Tax=Nocardioides massiliensis TaxID=1325935 RepID=A0ABT9NQH5_9ACTN|nr:monovalent cation/H(+) antiporter subunit G [Nocardioides massiliensis]MDP9822686.1 multicomponent Na+:H+ antiporter subunit G [Nocardioides massiliensis]
MIAAAEAVANVAVIVLLVAGTGFFVVGTVGVLRFPDLPTRLHAVAKADSLGLGLVTVGLVVHAVIDGGGLGVAAKLVLIWLLALLGTATNSHLLAVAPGEEWEDEPEDAP